MLIRHCRHTKMDLQLWDEMDEADCLTQINLVRLSRSMKAIREFSEQGPCYCGVSWGKDSVVVAHLCRLVNPKIPLIHLRPTNHNPDCDLVRDEYFAKFRGQEYHEHIVDYGDIHTRNLPDDEHDKLTDDIWYASIREVARKHGERYITGIRAAESGTRKMRCLIWNENTPNASAPIAWWTTQDVFSYLSQWSLPVHPAYACLGGGRWQRDNLRVAEIGDSRGRGMGRGDWELEYYGEELRRIQCQKSTENGT